MEQYIDSINYLGTINRNSDGTAPSETWPYAVKPEWIHDLLDLWERDKLLALYMEKASDRIAQDIDSASARRRTLYQITHDFVPLAAGGRQSRIASPNIWAVYSQLYNADQLAPAYLVNIVASNAIVNAVSGLVYRYYQTGEVIELREVRPFLVSRFGDRSPVRASANSVLRTLAYFGVLQLPTRPGQYEFSERLTVDAEIFPLLFWSWWRLRREPAIPIARLEDDPLMTFIDSASYDDYWDRYDGSLWTLEVRDGEDCAVLRPQDHASFVRTLFNMLASHPGWPAVSRQFLAQTERETV